MSIINELNKLKKEKKKCVETQSYEDAALIRDKERVLLEKLHSDDKEEFSKNYKTYIDSKIEEFKVLSEGKNCKQAKELFEYAIKNLKKYKMDLRSEMDWLKTKSVVELRPYKTDDQILNKWILENIISFEQWFKINYY